MTIRLTSSKAGVEELPVTISWLSPAPVLALFGEEARGLAGGVDVSTFCCGGGEDSSAARRASERTTVFVVLVGAVT
jgi:hypothetical protein